MLPSEERGSVSLDIDERKSVGLGQATAALPPSKGRRTAFFEQSIPLQPLSQFGGDTCAGEGERLGLAVGANEGVCVTGSSHHCVGADEGGAEGRAVGLSVGTVGSEVGGIVGAAVGSKVGDTVGATVGTSRVVGATVGTSSVVGATVGAELITVGAAVGPSVGGPVVGAKVGGKL